MKKINQHWNNFRIITSITGFITSIYCLICGIPNFPEVWGYFLIPMCYSFFQALGKKTFNRNSGIAFAIIQVIMFLRYVITPIITCSVQDQSRLFLYANSREHLGFAIFLMLYEMLAVYFALYIIVPRFMGINLFRTKQEVKEGIYINKTNGKIGIIQIAIIVFWFFIIIKSPECRSYLFRFADINIQTISQQEYQSQISGIYLVFYYIGLIVLYSSVISFIQKRKMVFKWNSIRLISIILVSISFISSTWSNGESVSRWALLIGAIVMMYILIQNFPNSAKAVILFGILGMVVLILVGSFAKSVVLGKGLTFSESVQSYISVRYINEYFSGIFPVANGITVAQHIEGNTIFVILYDLFANVPYFLSRLNLSTTATLVQFRHLTGRNDLIMPTITSGYAVFTAIFAPIYSVLMVCLAFKAEEKLRKSSNVLIQVFLLYIVYWCSLFMAVNINIIQSACWKYVIGIVLISLERRIFKRLD